MTVSRVINDHPNVTPETRARVQAVIEDLGYVANVAARTLAGGRSHVLGAISVQPESWGPSRTVFAIEAAAQAAGQVMTFRTVREPSVEAMREAFDELRRVSAEGVIVVARLSAAVDALAQLGPDIPTVIAHPAPTALTVGIDQERGARLATRHLVDLGHDDIVHVRGPKGWIDAEERAVGWRKELRAAGRLGTTILGDWTPRSGYAAGLEIARRDDVTAVFVANDQMALGVLLALHEAGRRVPEDISVVGFDDVPEAGFFIPPLTTVRQDFDELGKVSVTRVLDAVEGREAPAVAIEPELVLRASTARPRRKR